MLSNTTTVEGKLVETGIRPATPGEAAKAAVVVMLAFSTDPVARWVYPDPAQYLEHFPKFIRAFAGRGFDEGTAYISPDFAGAALWLQPGTSPDEEAMIELSQTSTTASVQRDLFPVFELMGQYHPEEPHWYLPMIGVDSRYQGIGIGSRLMEFALERCDRDGMPAYLESSNPRNIPLYERFGFELLGKIQVGDSAPLFPMIRKAG